MKNSSTLSKKSQYNTTGVYSGMFPRAVVILSLVALQACTSVDVQSVDKKYNISHICIEENPKVVSSNFVEGMENVFRSLGVGSAVYSGVLPASCEYRVKYSAINSWDMELYLSHAEVELFRGENKIGTAKYHLVGEGGFSLMKFGSVEEKMEPVLGQLLGRAK
jgi:hypothetical protein